MAEKKGGKKTQTKAGALGEKGNPMPGETDKDAPKKDTGKMPTISKEKSEGQRGDKPLH